MKLVGTICRSTDQSANLHIGQIGRLDGTHTPIPVLWQLETWKVAQIHLEYWKRRDFGLMGAVCELSCVSCEIQPSNIIVVL